MRITITKDDRLQFQAYEILMEVAATDVDGGEAPRRRQLHEQLEAIMTESGNASFYDRVVAGAQAQAEAEAEQFDEP